MEIYNIRLREKRIENNITLKEAADYIGVTEATMQRYESGKGIKSVPYDVISKLSLKYNCEPSYIMGWEKQKKTADTLVSVYRNKKIQVIVEVLSKMNDDQLDEFKRYAEFIIEKGNH